MSVNPNLTDEQRDVVSKVEKLLRLAGKTSSEAEASSATAKAQELLAAYNLDASTVGSGDSDGKRAQESVVGGYYDWERDLWKAVAELNFCMYWSQREWADRPEALKRGLTEEQRAYWAKRKRQVVVHKMVGRAVNIASTKVMANYLLEAVERLVRRFLGGVASGEEDLVVGLGTLLRGQRAMDFRRGVVSKVVDRIVERREVQLSEERKLQREAEAKAAEAGSAGMSSSTAITLSSYRQSERDANEDAVHGEGYSAKKRAARAQAAEERKRAQDSYTAWALANPEVVAKEEREREREDRKREKRREWYERNYGYRERRGGSDKTDWGAYYEGQRVGRDVGIDQQADSIRRRGLR